MDRIHENQVGEILPYQFEPEPLTKTSDASDDNNTGQSDVTTSSDKMSTTSLKEQILSCKCGHCLLSAKTVECFCCHGKALEYKYEVHTARYKLHAEFVAYIHTLYIN